METETPQLAPSEAEPVPEVVVPWWHRLVQCNPFYLFSALLLIYGIYRVSIDPHFVRTETLQVLFNFTSLEVYGAMLVGTANWLARKKIWYDSTMLVLLENILVLIPFMLVSHAVFLGSGLVWGICLIGTALAASKFGAFKRFFHGLNLPGELLAVGCLILTVNVAIPLVFRRGLDRDNELWATRSLYCWYVFLPLLVLLGNVLPNRDKKSPTAEAHEQTWIPLVSFLVWISGTAAHLYTIGYVDEQKFSVGNLSVMAWALCWLLPAKADHLFDEIKSEHKVALLVLPAAMSLLSLATAKPAIFIVLNLLNTLVFTIIACRSSSMKLPAVLAGASLLAAFAGVPESWGAAAIKNYNKAEILVAVAALAGLWASLRSRTARGGMLGSACAGIVALGVCGHFRLSLHVIVQAGAVYYLLHSLWRSQNQERGSTFSLVVMAIIWWVDSFSFGQSYVRYGMWAPSVTGLITFAMAWGAPFLAAKRSKLVMAAATGVLLINPVYRAIVWLTSAPSGLLALVASFVLFAAGTGFALWKRKTLFREPARAPATL